MFRLRALTVAGAAALLACNDGSGPGELTLAQIAGTWDLTQYHLLLESDTTVKLDFKAATGLTATIAIATNGAATLTVQLPGEAPITAQATIELRGDTLSFVDDSGGSFEFLVRLDSRAMTWLALYTDVFADVDGDGTDDETRERYVWQRR